MKLHKTVLLIQCSPRFLQWTRNPNIDKMVQMRVLTECLRHKRQTHSHYVSTSSSVRRTLVNDFSCLQPPFVNELSRNKLLGLLMTRGRFYFFLILCLRHPLKKILSFWVTVSRTVYVGTNTLTRKSK